jgi:hypothetical protein
LFENALLFSIDGVDSFPVFNAALDSNGDVDGRVLLFCSVDLGPNEPLNEFEPDKLANGLLGAAGSSPVFAEAEDEDAPNSEPNG